MHARTFAPAVGLVDGILYGGDYNPEQWSPSTWKEDIGLMKEAGVNLVTLGVFSWAILEPSEGEYDFSRMDILMELLSAGGIKVDLATGTAAQPAWASVAYTDIAPMDERGMRFSHGSRQSYCPNSPSYLRLSRALVEALGKRYAAHPALALWHVNNEVACHLQACTCDTCAALFRKWLASRYGGLERLNEAWGTAFWSQRYSSWEEIVPPRVSTASLNPAARLDYRRFMSDSFLDLVRGEAGILRRVSPGIPITTNLMWTDGADWFRLDGVVDALAYDSYPDPSEKESWRWAAYMFDLTRGHLGGKPWLLMEQAPSQVNWRPLNAAKKPGLMRLWSSQALAHGSDSVLFFQWRASVRGSEQFHSAMLPHAGASSRRHAEVKAFGMELARLSGKNGSLPGLAGSVVSARAALINSYDSWWFSQYRPFPTDAYDYQRFVRDWHDSLSRLHVPVDIISPRDSLDGYGLVLAPALFLADEELLSRLGSFVKDGGTLATGIGAAMVDEEGKVRTGGYGGQLARLCGIHIQEYDVETPRGGVTAGGYPVHAWFDLIEAAKETEVLAFYEGGSWLAGFAAATKAKAGKGNAYWLGTRAESSYLDAFMADCLAAAGIEGLVAAGPDIEACVRLTASGEELLFVMNHGEGEGRARPVTKGWKLVHGPGVIDEGEELALTPLTFAVLSRRA